MYNERKDGFSITNLIFKIVLVVLFALILIWLFPINNNTKTTNTDLDFLKDRIFNENIQAMKEAAIFYYTTPRLPKNVDDVKKMTLREMLNEKLLLEFKDSNNKSCDLDKSYVEITKLEDEYLLKVNLTCTDNSAYILVHIGCYDYCETDVCEKKEEVTQTPIVNPTPVPNNPTPTPVDPKPNTPTEPEKTCSYKYEKVETNSKWSDWSKWSTTKVTANDTTKVETKTETKSEVKNVLIGKKVTTYLDKSSPITENVQVQVDTVSVSYCSNYGAQYTSTGEKKYEWIDQGTAYYNVQPKSDANTKYEYVGSTTVDCHDCYNGVLYIYRKYSLKVYDVVTKDEVCTETNTISAPIYITLPKIVGYNTYTKETPVYGDKTFTTETKYYRYKTLKTTSKTLTKWSTNSNDTALINQGYKYVTSVCK